MTFSLVVALGAISARADEPSDRVTTGPTAEPSVQDQYKAMVVLATAQRKNQARISTQPLVAGSTDHTSETVNRYFSFLWRSSDVTYTAADDATFLRRASLALNGVPAGRQEAMAFLADDSPQKRAAKVEELLTNNRYADYWGFRLRAWIIDMREVAGESTDFLTLYHYARKAMAENRNWRQIAEDLLQSQDSTTNDGRANFGVYFDGKPNEFADAAVRLFLGVNLACAQCHDHPYITDWKRESYWGLAAYFARARVWSFNDDPNVVKIMERVPLLGRAEHSISTLPGGDFAVDQPYLSNGENRAVADIDEGEINIPDLKNVHIQPTPLGGLPVTDADSKPQSRRAQFVTWMVADKGFSRAVVNRLWLELTGRGFVADVEGFSPENEPDYEELLDELADGFVQHGHDLKWLMRTIVLSDVFQAAQGNSEDADVVWHQWKPRLLNSDQWHDSVVRVTGEEDRMYQVGAELAPLLAEERRSRQQKRKVLLAEAVVQLKKGRFAQLASQLPKFEAVSEDGIRDITEAERKQLKELRSQYANAGGLLKDTRGEARRSGSLSTESLCRMNGKLVSQCLQHGLAASQIASIPDVGERLDAVYLAVLGRHANELERTRLAGVGSDMSVKDTVKDLVWVLMQTAEFQTF